MKVIVHGAGAVGCVLGGMLALRRHDVLLTGRPPLVDAVTREGLRMKTATGEYHVHPRAAESVSASEIDDDTCVLLTVKSCDVAAAARELAGIVRPTTPVVCMQNGIAAEEEAGKALKRVLGGVVRMTCSMVQPAHVAFRSPGRVIVGAYPKGADPLARPLAAALTEAGFDAAASRDIGCDKWLKLAVNAQSAFHAVIDPRDHDLNEFIDLQVAILEETKRVMKAAKVRAKSCDGKDPSIDEMIAELRRPRARRVEHGVKVHNSLWQDLYLRRPRIESEYIHGPLVALAVRHGIPAPYHRTALAVATDAHRAQRGPETMRLADVLAIVERERE